MRKIVVLLIDGYRLVISPWLGSNCRFYPSCSAYARTAILRFGVLKGSWMSFRRLARCHPWHEGGIDPVPENKK